MTKETFIKLRDALASFDDPFERAFQEVFERPIWRPLRGHGDPVDMIEDAMHVEFDIYGREVLFNYEEALARGADPDESFKECAMRLAVAIGADTNDDAYDRSLNFTFGIIQHLINKAFVLMYVSRFWYYVGTPGDEIHEKRLENWFLAPDSPRHQFRNCHCLMNDRTIDCALSKYRESGKIEAIKKDRWSGVSWRKLISKETGDRYSVKWYDRFQVMAAELTGRLGLYPIEFLFCIQPGIWVDFEGTC